MTVALETPSTGAATTVSGLLAATYRQLGEVCEALTVRVVDPAPAVTQMGVSGAELTKDQVVLDAFVLAEAVRIEDRYDHTPRRDVAASRALHDYAWSVGLLMSGVWYLTGRVPRIRPEDVRLDLTTGVFGISPGPDLACLPDDPAAALPGALTVPHEEALRAELRVAVADHMEPLLSAIAPLIRRGPRALWGMVADDLVSGVWYLGRMLGQEADAVRAAGALLPTAVQPFPGGADFRHLTGSDGRQHPTRTRLGCCLYYTIRPAEACATCPRTCDAERLRRIEG
ncbi:(2Fe-2S)-binding protein [Streptomyces sp. NBC_00878]|uniref:(2Fe-2S)-binding protein n=1 Tax=Streptomyces sp. NBC_00878 TaxID=2975854 RepID=UPI002259B902|nr:(2Fe-2S)-binding protein [Streptomyces sp. NBC_00878]MCX4911720.1 (2Fe-2S)-binding protein [Streptomyces sp. NBC_00878]